jgi:hypothetical protein
VAGRRREVEGEAGREPGTCTRQRPCGQADRGHYKQHHVRCRATGKRQRVEHGQLGQQRAGHQAGVDGYPGHRARAGDVACGAATACPRCAAAGLNMCDRVRM